MVLQNSISCRKHLHGRVFSLTHYTSTRGHPYKLYKPHFSTTTRAQFFSERVINVLNALPVDVIDFGSVKRFRCSLLKVDLSSFTKCSKLSMLY